jgi:hypothetical protein
MKSILKKIKYFFWDKPVSAPPKEAPIRVKGEQVFDDYMVFEYKKQQINLRKSELPMWNALSREDKRAMAKRFEVMEKKGQIRFELINGKRICLKNKNYENKAHSK